MKLAAVPIAAIVAAVSFAVLAIALALVSSPALAQERANCPNGFFWERMSGQCCVQDRATLPAYGRIGYTGNSLCAEGYEGIYERRPTTDGQGPPGCPGYTSFVFLVECVTPGEWDKRAQELARERDKKNEPVGGAASTLYGGGGKPSKEQVAGAGAAAAALTAGAVAATRSGVPTQRRRLEQLLRDADRQYRRLLQQEDVAYREWQSMRKTAEWYIDRALIHLIGPSLFAAGSITAGASAMLLAEKTALISKLLIGGGAASIGVATEVVPPGDALRQAQAAWEQYKKLSPKVEKAFTEWRQARKATTEMKGKVDALQRELDATPAWTASAPFKI